jgi:hypothetical protein
MGMMGVARDKARANGPLEANVVLELRLPEATSEEVLDANSDDVLEAVEQHASNVALGPTISLNLEHCAIRLRFDVLADHMPEVHKKIAQVLGIIEKRTDLEFSRSNVAAQTGAATSEYAAV